MGVRGLRIGELAALGGVTARAIRYYERLGLLGAPARADNGYRTAGPNALLDVAEIRRLQSVGLSLRDIGALRRGASSTADRAEMQELHELDGRLRDQISALDARRRSLEALARTLDGGGALLASDGEPADFAPMRELLRRLGTSDRASIGDRADEYAGAAAALDLFARLRDVEPDDPLVDATVMQILELVRTLPEHDALAREWQEDPAVPPVLHAIATSFTAAQQRAVVEVLRRLQAGEG